MDIWTLFPIPKGLLLRIWSNLIEKTGVLVWVFRVFSLNCGWFPHFSRPPTGQPWPWPRRCGMSWSTWGKIGRRCWRGGGWDGKVVGFLYQKWDAQKIDEISWFFWAVVFFSHFWILCIEGVWGSQYLKIDVVLYIQWKATCGVVWRGKFLDIQYLFVFELL